MTSSNGNIFRVTGPLCGEFTGPGEFPTQRPVTRSFDVFFDLRLNKVWVNNRETGDLRRHRTHYDVTVMVFKCGTINPYRKRKSCLFMNGYDVIIGNVILVAIIDTHSFILFSATQLQIGCSKIPSTGTQTSNDYPRVININVARMSEYRDSSTSNGHQPTWASYQYVKLRVAHGPGMPGTFSPPPWVSDSDMHHGTCVTHVLWSMPGSLTSGFRWSRWRGKRSRPSRRMRNPQFHVSCKRPMPYRCKIPNFTGYFIIIWCDNYILYLSNGHFSYQFTDVLTEIGYNHWTVNLGNKKYTLRMAGEVDNKVRLNTLFKGNIPYS